MLVVELLLALGAEILKAEEKSIIVFKDTRILEPLRIKLLVQMWLNGRAGLL